MPAASSQSSAQPVAVAPDGIAIYTFDLPAAAHVSVAEGRIPPGTFGIHRHLSLEQFTYVVFGSVTVIAGDAEHPAGRTVALRTGDLLLTLPWESLQFINEGTDEARVLFICAPPYPQDDTDTRTLDSHAPLSGAERAEAIARLETVRAEFNRAIDRRVTQLRRGTVS